MKRNLLQKLIFSLGLVIAILVSPLKVHSQEIIRTAEGDTLITITPPQLKVLNCIITDYEYSLKREELLKNKTITLEHKITHLDSLIRLQDIQSREMFEVYTNNMESLRIQMEREVKKQRKAGWIKGGIGGAIVGGLLVFLLCR